ncbi:Outer membrane protein beta-barrel domain-containing protein [Filimonas lacunae]|uniref:Outer membrane protein beta-barrel domain-containing protein n=1 Tax=Filimonas lacunae TaxID=477680 RepID=A0A173MRU6_9BACT|nr:outer membrane beta-barrel protein [Filimonas lacunae]BAV10383.1 hypothetical protein FLA_6445 [Filimonas lacunae]SIT16398.1 Outer membrane protein beta-barrel domain-containing protein [Filimonas lacunae]
MKKVLLFASILFAGVAANAQINKGQWLAGGTLGFSSSKAGDNKTTNINLNPNAGYFVINNLAVGLEADYGYSKYKTKVAGADFSTKTTSIGAAPFVRYYVLPTAQKTNVFVHGAYAFGSTKSDDASSVSFNAFKFAAGPAFFLTPSVALEASVYYQSQKAKYDAERTNTFGLAVGFQVHLGKAKK